MEIFITPDHFRFFIPNTPNVKRLAERQFMVTSADNRTDMKMKAEENKMTLNFKN